MFDFRDRDRYNYKLLINLIRKHLEVSEIDKRLKFNYKFDDELINLLELMEEEFVKSELNKLNEKDS